MTGMIVLARTSSNLTDRQRGCYTRTMSVRDFGCKKSTGHEPQDVWRQDELIGPKPPCRIFFFLVSWVGARLRPLGTSATNWPIVSAPDDR
jgi:hypothetical protein